MEIDPIKSGSRIRIHPFPEVAEVYRCERRGEKIILGVIFTKSKRAETFVLASQEFTERVFLLPSLKEEFLEGHFLPRESFLLYSEALRMRLAYTFDPHYAVSVTQVDMLPHQVDAVYRHLIPLPRIRFLLADDPGLGKTIMAGLTLKELKARLLVKNTLLIVPAHLQDQWRREMWDWFREDFTILDRGLLDNIYSDEFFIRNPQIITSIDFAKRENVRQSLARRYWDMIIVDEAHKFSATRYGKKIDKTQRYQLGEAISSRSNHLLFLTATPHRGDESGYFLLLNLLEPKLFANEKQLKDASKGNGLPFVLRRSKEQVTDLYGKKLFKKREVNSLSISLTDSERDLYEAVTSYVRRWYSTIAGKTDRRSRNIALALTVLQRRLSSSLMAIRESLRRRRVKLQNLLNEWGKRLEEDETLPFLDEEGLAELSDQTASEWESFQERLEGLTAARTPEELKEEIDELERLIKLAIQAEKEGEEAKVKELGRLVEERLRQYPEEKLLIFTEFKDTLKSLQQKFEKVWGFSVSIIHGEMNLQARISEERRFRDQVQVMVATDAAGEGINLQFCRLMVNFDLPWNPNRLEQRMGRIHRYGQKRDCFVFNLLYPETREGKVLERLLNKLEEMRKRPELGDTVYDVIGTLLEGVRLEDLIMQAILRGDSKEVERIIEVDVEQRFEEFRKALEESALAGHHIDLSSVQQEEVDSRLNRLVPWDVERFTKLALVVIGGSLEPDRRREGVYRLSIPREFARKYKLDDESYVHGFRVAFERQIARDSDAEFFAPGHPLLEDLCDHFLNKSKPIKSVFIDEKGREGYFWLFNARVKDGQDKPVIERLIPIFYDNRMGQLQEVDPRMIWELESPPRGWQIPQSLASDIDNIEERVRKEVTSRLENLYEEAQKRRDREGKIKRQWLERSFDTLISESNEKLFDYHKRAEKGEEMRIAIQQEEENLKALVREKEERLEALNRERTLTILEPELEAVAVVLSKQSVESKVAFGDEALKRQVEQAGISEAMSYEREHGREPEDVSNERRGFDIISIGRGETRFIEVKAFMESGPLELTPHEWQMAHRLGDSYWLYAVENALTQPRLTPIQNPAKNLKPKEVWGVVKMIISEWKS